MKKYIFSIVYGLLLAAFTIYIMLDTFVLARVYDTVEQGSPPPVSEDKNAVQTENSYSDENISITLTEHRVKDTAVYVAEVKLSSSEYLKTAFANNTYGKNIKQKTSENAKANSALLAVNGDFYGARERGYVLRNGLVYRQKGTDGQEALVIYRDGSFGIADEGQVSADTLKQQGAWQILSFGPALVKDSEISVTDGQEVAQSMKSNPRTAIGVIENNHYIIVVSDGRTDESRGLSLLELAEFMQSLGATTAYNLDGGGSATMYFNGRIVNKPTTNGKTIKERSVSDIVYIGY